MYLSAELSDSLGTVFFEVGVTPTDDSINDYLLLSLISINILTIFYQSDLCSIFQSQ
jgi:hypothetical protein